MDTHTFDGEVELLKRMTLGQTNAGKKEWDIDCSTDCLITSKLDQSVSKTESRLRCLLLAFRDNWNGAGKGVLESLLPVPVDGNVDDGVEYKLTDWSRIDVVERFLRLLSALEASAWANSWIPFLGRRR
jgi:hypothetical protein